MHAIASGSTARPAACCLRCRPIAAATATAPRRYLSYAYENPRPRYNHSKNNNNNASSSSSSSSSSRKNGNAAIAVSLMTLAGYTLFFHHKPVQNDTAASPTSSLHDGAAHRGVHLWGSNRTKLINPDLSAPSLYKKPQYLVQLSGQAFRDLALHEGYAVAVTPKGDLLQWGSGYSKDVSSPTITLRGQDIVQVALTPSKIYGRTKHGKVVILSSSKLDQEDPSRPLPSQAWYWRLLGYADPGVHFVEMDFSQDLTSSKRVTDIQAGRSHLLALTADGKALCAAVDSEANELGQLGGGSKLTDAISSKAVADKEIIQTRDIRYDTTLKVIPALRNLKIMQIAAGDRHSLALTTERRTLAWGNNSVGQLALGASYAFPYIPTPTECQLQATKTARVACQSIHAGGDLSYFVVNRDDLKMAPGDQEQAALSGERRMYQDLLAAGNGMYGGIGNGSFMSTSQPLKVKTVSGLTEFDEATQTIQSIPIHSVSIGSTHCAVVLQNAVHDKVTKQSFGNDVFLFGHNESYQLGTGKRSNLNIPQHIPPLPYPLTEEVKEKLASKVLKGTKKAEETLESGTKSHMPHNRLQMAPRTRGVEERIVTGFGTTAVYWHVDS